MINRLETPTLKQRQHGAALAISLILLVAMTILGVSALNSSRLSERVSSNAQQKAITFETAESVLMDVSSAADYRQKLEASRTSLIEPDPVLMNAETVGLNTLLDQFGSGGASTVDVDAVLTIQFCGEGIVNGTELSSTLDQATLIGYLYDVNSVASISNSNASSDHVMRQAVAGLKVDSIGKCVLPGQ